MSRAYTDIAFTTAVRDMQTRMGSRATVGGSVEGGGLLRELTTTTIKPAP